MRRLNLGCGREQIIGWINIDKNPSCGPDMVRDLEKGLPFDDNSVDEVQAKHIIEHIEDDAFLMNEIWRVCKPKAKVILVFPTVDGTGVCDWGHKSFWNKRKVEYLENNKRANYTGLECDFVIKDLVEFAQEEAKVIEAVLEVRK